MLVFYFSRFAWSVSFSENLLGWIFCCVLLVTDLFLPNFSLCLCIEWMKLLLRCYIFMKSRPVTRKAKGWDSRNCYRTIKTRNSGFFFFSGVCCVLVHPCLCTYLHVHVSEHEWVQEKKNAWWTMGKSILNTACHVSLTLRKIICL